MGKFIYKKENNAPSMIIILLALLLTFVAPGSDYYFPVISLSVIYKGVGILLCSVLLLIFHKNTKTLRIDIIVTFLFLRFLLYSFQIVQYGANNYLSHYLASFLCVFSYLTSINTKINRKDILKLGEIIVLVSGIQAIIAIISGFSAGLQLYMLKSHINTPIGSSNMLAVIWILFYPVIYYCERRRNIRIFFKIFIPVLILLSRSNTGLIVFTLVLLYLLSKEQKHKLLRIVWALIIAIIAIEVISKYFNAYFDRTLSTLVRFFEGNYGSREESLNGRIDVFKTAIGLFMQKPIFGLGFMYRDKMPNYMMTHNWALENLVTGGIVTLILWMGSILVAIHKCTINKNEETKKLFMVIIYSSLLQGFFEPSFGSYIFDSLFWLLLGVFVKEFAIINPTNKGD